MSFVVLALMAALASGFVLLALFRPIEGAGDEGRDARMQALRAQLREVEGDRDQGRLTPHEFELARAEIARALFRLEDEPAAAPSTGGRRPILWASALAVPLLAAGAYIAVGAPNLEAQPHAERHDLRALLARAEARLRKTPDDLRGWRAVAPVYARLGRAAEAAAAYERALSEKRVPARMRSAMLAEWAEASTLGVGKPLAAAMPRLEEAVSLHAGNVKARFLLAMATEETAPEGEAAKTWRALLDRYPNASEGWAQIARARLSRLRIAESMAPDERGEQINGMVASLANRLEADPDDLDGWIRLIRSYAVLGRAGAARSALARARDQFEGRTDALARLDAGAKASGIAVK